MKTRWAGRIERIKDNPIFIIDGAHNEDGAKSLARAIENNFKEKKLTLLIGMLEDKDIDTVLDILIPKFNKIITTTPDSPRAMDSSQLRDKVLKYNKNVIDKSNVEDAVDYVLENSNSEDVIISAGSLYMIGHVRTIINNK